jgi:hypothetical protein
MPLQPLTQHIPINIHGIPSCIYINMVGSTQISQKKVGDKYIGIKIQQYKIEITGMHLDKNLIIQ